MKPRLPILALAVTVLLFAAGCQSVDNRIREKPDVFAKLDKVAQDKIKQGIIDIGFTPDMVYLALGEPDEKRDKLTSEGRSEIWIYNTYYERFDGTAHIGYFRRVYYDPFLRAYRLFYQPAYADTYSSTKEERIRVVFKDGKAAVIEQTKG